MLYELQLPFYNKKVNTSFGKPAGLNDNKNYVLTQKHLNTYMVSIFW